MQTDRNLEESPAPAGLSRRQALKKGALAGGLVWVAPTIATVILTPGTAEATSGPGGGGGGTPPPPPTGLPSHGFFLLRTGATAATYKFYGFQIAPNANQNHIVSCLTSPGNGN